MDFLPKPIFEYDLAEELLQISSFPGYQDANEPHQLPETTPQDGCDLTHSGSQCKSTISYDGTETIPDGNSKNKRTITHRDFERQRRKEVAGLYANLRSHVTVEFLKGKRSTSDQVNEAVNYIKHLHNEIQDLNNKRDELKRLSSFPRNAAENSLSSVWDSVEIRPYGAGVEVVINAREGLPLSEVLKALMEEGLLVFCNSQQGLLLVGFISTRVNERLIHTIKTELSDGQNIDLCELQKKLKGLIISSAE